MTGQISKERRRLPGPTADVSKELKQRRDRRVVGVAKALQERDVTRGEFWMWDDKERMKRTKGLEQSDGAEERWTCRCSHEKDPSIPHSKTSNPASAAKISAAVVFPAPAR